jgi:hypothetical protein
VLVGVAAPLVKYYLLFFEATVKRYALGVIYSSSIPQTSRIFHERYMTKDSSNIHDIVYRL